jgi:hypothetical protein
MTDAKAPSGLPPPVASDRDGGPSAVERARRCPKCHRDARIVSGQGGIHAFCGPCKYDWPIANSVMHPNTSFTLPRGLSKQALVPMDVSKLYEE